MKINEPTPPIPTPAIQSPLDRGPRAGTADESAVGPSTTPVAKPTAGPGAPPTGQTDRVEISDEARSRSAQLEGESPATAPADKPSVSEIRQRIHDGVYESDAVIDSIARRILDRGDL
jgi:anti-sigma28 factor (negative regulator of flagellin synthesis)